jgi:hypothetical protein
MNAKTEPNVAHDNNSVEQHNEMRAETMDDRLHEALIQSFDCGDPIALCFTD